MKINSLSSISFKSTPLHDVKIMKRGESGSFKEVDASFSLLNPNDKHDVRAVNKVARSWWRAKYARMIARNFNIKILRNFSTFYALELKGDEPLNKRIVSLCEVSNSPLDFPNCYIDLLQASPSISKNRTPKYKGAGEVTIYGVIKEAKNENIKGVTLTSSDKACQFYKHIGFEPDNFPNGYILPDHKYEAYISRVEDKYNF